MGSIDKYTVMGVNISGGIAIHTEIFLFLKFDAIFMAGELRKGLFNPSVMTPFWESVGPKALGRGEGFGGVVLRGKPRRLERAVTVIVGDLLPRQTASID